MSKMEKTKIPAMPVDQTAPKQRAVVERKKEPKQISEPASMEHIAKPLAPKQHIKTPKTKEVNGKLALVLVRGLVRIRTETVATLYTLGLRQSHACVVIDDAPSNRASASKCKDYVAYGEINEETHRLLVEKRGRKDRDGKLKKYFLLHPPRGGFERKGIKTPFSTGGALGYRGAKINDLIKKML
jgi:large subunit ribosomal protein L30